MPFFQARHLTITGSFISPDCRDFNIHAAAKFLLSWTNFILNVLSEPWQLKYHGAADFGRQGPNPKRGLILCGGLMLDAPRFCWPCPTLLSDDLMAYVSFLTLVSKFLD